MYLQSIFYLHIYIYFNYVDKSVVTMPIANLMLLRFRLYLDVTRTPLIIRINTKYVVSELVALCSHELDCTGDGLVRSRFKSLVAPD